MRARLRVDGRQICVLAVFDLQDDCGLDRVAVGVELVGAGDARESCILYGIPDVRAFDRAGSLERVEEQSRGIIAKSSACIGCRSVLGRVCCYDSLDFGAGVVVGEAAGADTTHEGRATYLDEVG